MGRFLIALLWFISFLFFALWMGHVANANPYIFVPASNVAQGALYYLPTGKSITDVFPPDMRWIDVGNLSPFPGAGWTYNPATGTFTAPAAGSSSGGSGTSSTTGASYSDAQAVAANAAAISQAVQNEAASRDAAISAAIGSAALNATQSTSVGNAITSAISGLPPAFNAFSFSNGMLTQTKTNGATQSASTGAGITGSITRAGRTPSPVTVSYAAISLLGLAIGSTSTNVNVSDPISGAPQIGDVCDIGLTGAVPNGMLAPTCRISAAGVATVTFPAVTAIATGSMSLNIMWRG